MIIDAIDYLATLLGPQIPFWREPNLLKFALEEKIEIVSNEDVGDVK